MRLIDADAVDYENIACSQTDLRWLHRIFEKQPTIDAVPVVRCKDCKWYKEGNLLAPTKFCFRLKHPKEDRQIGYAYSDDDFCSYGERMGKE